VLPQVKDYWKAWFVLPPFPVPHPNPDNRDRHGYQTTLNPPQMHQSKNRFPRLHSLQLLERNRATAPPHRSRREWKSNTKIGADEGIPLCFFCALVILDAASPIFILTQGGDTKLSSFSFFCELAGLSIVSCRVVPYRIEIEGWRNGEQVVLGIPCGSVHDIIFFILFIFPFSWEGLAGLGVRITRLGNVM
jgi:hypothetical protein